MYKITFSFFISVKNTLIFIVCPKSKGKINNINVNVKGYLRSEYVRSRLSRNLIDQVYNQIEIERTILTLQEVDPNIDRLEVKAEIDPQAPESVNLRVEAFATPALSVTGITANNGSPAFGEINTAFQLESRILGNGDRLSGLYVVSEGNEGFNFRYSTPINAKNTQVFVSYSQNTGNIVENPLSFADIDVQSESYALGFVQSLIETPFERLSLGVTGGFQQSIGSLEGLRVPIFRGAEEDGDLKVSTVRFPLNYFVRDRLNIFEVNSQLSLGVDALGATTNNEGKPDSRFVTLKNEARYIRILNPETNTYFQLRGILQVAKDSLPGFDAFSLGGLNTVRGYRQNQVFSDNALFLSAELAVPLYRSENGDISVRLAPFLDYGKGWNTDLPNPEISSLLSTGVGLQQFAT